MTDPDYSIYGHAEVTTNSKGRRIVLFNGIMPTVAEWCYVAERMAVIQKEDFPEDDNACLSIVGDVLEIKDDNTEEETYRWAKGIDKKWDAVRLIKRQWRAG